MRVSIEYGRIHSHPTRVRAASCVSRKIPYAALHIIKKVEVSAPTLLNYLLSTPYFLLNLSIRPLAAAAFC